MLPKCSQQSFNDTCDRELTERKSKAVDLAPKRPLKAWKHKICWVTPCSGYTGTAEEDVFLVPHGLSEWIEEEGPGISEAVKGSLNPFQSHQLPRERACPLSVAQCLGRNTKLQCIYCRAVLVAEEERDRTGEAAVSIGGIVG